MPARTVQIRFKVLQSMYCWLYLPWEYYYKISN